MRLQPQRSPASLTASQQCTSCLKSTYAQVKSYTVYLPTYSNPHKLRINSSLDGLAAHVCRKCFLSQVSTPIPTDRSRAHVRTGFRVWIKTVPGPVNLQTSPSAEAMFEMMPPDATRSRMYLVFQATKCPLSTMYFSSSTSCDLVSGGPFAQQAVDSHLCG